MIIYYVYKINFADGDYYFGKHKFSGRGWENPSILHDGYWGSGKLLKSKITGLLRKYWENQPEQPHHDMEAFLNWCDTDFTTACLNAKKLGFSKEIIKEFDTSEEALAYEKQLIKLHINDAKCLNIRGK